MTAKQGRWLWVFGEIKGLRWVVAHKRMAFSRAGVRAEAMREGDRAVLYVARGAFHNPTRDTAHLAGLATVTGQATSTAVEIGGRRFPVSVPIRIDLLLPERTGPEVAPLADRLSFVKRAEVWGVYFRNSPKRLAETDFRILAGAVSAFAKREVRAE
jgi:hypothetical protein